MDYVHFRDHLLFSELLASALHGGDEFSLICKAADHIDTVTAFANLGFS